MRDILSSFTERLGTASDTGNAGEDVNGQQIGSRRLAEAVRAAKVAAAHRSDVVVDIREADRARLEILAEELQPVVREIPADDEFFDFALSGGPQPRFWIDMTAHVTMARDRRTYRFVRESRLGRLVLAESSEARVIADRITSYVADRIVEREKALVAVDEATSARTLEDNRSAQPIRHLPLRAGRAPSTDLVLAASWLMIGIVIGAGVLMALASWRGLVLG